MNSKNPRYRFKKAWSWPTEIEAKIKSLLEGEVLHVCSGESQIGNVRIDLSKSADIRADMFWLPIRPESFDTVLCDPPWNLPYHVRHKLLFQLRDCLKPGGRLIFNCFWIPKIRGLQMESEIFVGIPNAAFRNVSVLFLARRMALPDCRAELVSRGSGVRDLNLLKALYWNNRRRWRSNLSIIWTEIFAFAVLYFTLQTLLGFSHFYAVVNQALASAKIVQFTAHGNYIIVPANSTDWSLWKPGQQLIITSQARDTMNTINFVVTGLFSGLGIVMFGEALWKNFQHSRLEIEAREYKYRYWLFRTLDPNFVTRIAVGQNFLFSALSIGISIPFAAFVLVPATVVNLDRELPGISEFFVLSWADAAVLSIPLIVIFLARWYFTAKYTKRFLARMV